MSRPKELNFFVEELNLAARPRLVREPLLRRRPGSRRDLAPLHEPAPLRRASPSGCAATLGEGARLIYMVRDPIDRLLSHYLHNPAAGYDDRARSSRRSPTSDSAYVDRSRYAFQLEPYLEHFGRRSDRGRRAART